MSKYNSVFFDYVSAGAIRSAEKLWPYILDMIPVGSVLDVGCGRGAWLSVALKMGVAEVTGVDGNYVEREKLLIPQDRFLTSDLRSGFSVPGEYDLVISLEVAEHLPPSQSAGFVENLVGHGDLILFSAAPKGQGGHDHVNEQDYVYWQELFATHGYLAIDYLRPLLKKEKGVEPWYRYNSLLYATPDRLATLPQSMRSCVIPAGEAVVDVSPLFYRARKLFMRLLPVSVMTLLARIKEAVTIGIGRSSS